MRLRIVLAASIVLSACAHERIAQPGYVPAGIVVPAGMRPGSEYRGLQIGRSGDGGIWAAPVSTITLAAGRVGSKLVLVLYEPSDRARSLGVSFGPDRAQRWCCLHGGVQGAPFPIPPRERGRSRLTFRLTIADPPDTRHGAVLMRAFTY